MGWKERLERATRKSKGNPDLQPGSDWDWTGGRVPVGQCWSGGV